MFKKKKSKLLDSTKASKILREFEHKPKEGKTTLSEIVEEFHENGLLMTMIFFSLPVAVPLPYPPGFTTIMGIPIIILAIEMICGVKEVKLPKRIQGYSVNNSMLRRISSKIAPVAEFIEKHIKPRFDFAKSTYCEQFVGVISLISAIAIILPFPWTNSIPAIGISIMSLGLLGRDGVTIFIGFLVSIIGVMIAAFAAIGSFLFIKYLFSSIFFNN